MTTAEKKKLFLGLFTPKQLELIGISVCSSMDREDMEEYGFSAPDDDPDEDVNNDPELRELQEIVRLK